MSVYTESGIRVDLSGKAHHRFETLVTYRSLSSHGLKEIDFCWLEPATDEDSPDKLICLELKGYQSTAMTDDVINKVLTNLEQKIKDTLLMFGAAWSARGRGVDLAPELPLPYRTYDPKRKIQLIMLVDEDSNQAAALMALKQKLQNRLRGMTLLLDFDLTVVNRDVAERVVGLPISAENTD